ncbi:MAG: hypothetical protein DRP06_00350 [Candidatus Aenigmatarchaeota archaeon]|nr:MAG: hypothetical protein DRP06_00350 [Candidatus Aenigmarchaeota archaeon]
MHLKLKTTNFNFLKTFNSGLFYFFYDPEPVRKIIIGGKPITLKFKQTGNQLIISYSEEIEKDKKTNLINRIKYCLGLEEDLSEFYNICKKDIILKNHLEKIRDTRVISAFSDFEALVGAIISQNNSYRNYRIQMHRVYEKLNFTREAYKEKNLCELKLGYKANYLLDLAKNFEKMELKNIHGIGNYSINLFNIFQKRDYNYFYMDCLTEKIMRENYKITENFEEASIKLWGKYRGLAEAYLQRFFEVK